MEKSLSSVLRARVRSWLAPCGIALPVALAGCGGAASPAGPVSPKAVEPPSSKSSSPKRHLTPELVVALPESFVESRTPEGETYWLDRDTELSVRAVVFPVPFDPLSVEMRKKLALDDPDVRIEDKTRGKARSLEFSVRQPARLQQAYLTLAQVSDGKRSAVLGCGGLLSIRPTCKEAIDSVWFAKDERTSPKPAPRGQRWLELQSVYVLVPEDFQPDEHARGAGVKLGPSRISFSVMNKAERVSLSDALKMMSSDDTVVGTEIPLKRSVGFANAIEVVHAVQTGESSQLISRLFPLSMESSALTVCSAPERVFQAQPKRCAALLDAIEVVTPTPLVNARAEGGSTVR